MSSAPVTIRPVQTKKDKKAFVDFAWDVYKDDPAWVPPLKDEVHGLITPGKNPWFEHAKAQLWLAERGGKVVGRISAQVDELVQEHMGQGIGQWGMFEALDGEAAAALIATAEDWLRAAGHDPRARPDQPVDLGRARASRSKASTKTPTVMMGHHRPEYRAWIEAAGYAQGQGPADLRGRHRPLGRSQDQPPDRDGRAQPAHPHPHGRQVASSTRKRGSSSTCSTTPGRATGATSR